MRGQGVAFPAKVNNLEHKQQDFYSYSLETIELKKLFKKNQQTHITIVFYPVTSHTL